MLVLRTNEIKRGNIFILITINIRIGWPLKRRTSNCLRILHSVVWFVRKEFLGCVRSVVKSVRCLHLICYTRKITVKSVQSRTGLQCVHPLRFRFGFSLDRLGLTVKKESWWIFSILLPFTVLPVYSRPRGHCLKIFLGKVLDSSRNLLVGRVTEKGKMGFKTPKRLSWQRTGSYNTGGLGVGRCGLSFTNAV